MNMPAPVALFTYNRPDHLKKVFDSLIELEGREKTNLFIFCDGSKNEHDELNVIKVRNLCDLYKNKLGFKKVEIIKRNKNIGLANSIIYGVSNIISQHNKIIVLEDDLIVNKQFLIYMNESLNFYEKNDNIWSISGYSFNMNSLNNYDHDIFLSSRGCSWGWATWKDRWTLTDWKCKEYKQFKNNFYKRKNFSLWGNDLPVLLDLQMKNRIDSWALRWCFSEYNNKMYTIYPKNSFVKCIGMDGSGTHNPKTNKFDVNIEYKKYKLEDVCENIKIRKEFKKQYSYSIITIFKIYLKTFLKKS